MLLSNIFVTFLAASITLLISCSNFSNDAKIIAFNELVPEDLDALYYNSIRDVGHFTATTFHDILLKYGQFEYTTMAEIAVWFQTLLELSASQIRLRQAVMAQHIQVCNDYLPRVTLTKMEYTLIDPKVMKSSKDILQNFAKLSKEPELTAQVIIEDPGLLEKKYEELRRLFKSLALSIIHAKLKSPVFQAH